MARYRYTNRINAANQYVQVIEERWEEKLMCRHAFNSGFINKALHTVGSTINWCGHGGIITSKSKKTFLEFKALE